LLLKPQPRELSSPRRSLAAPCFTAFLDGNRGDDERGGRLEPLEVEVRVAEQADEDRFGIRPKR
jgi:hypothetical protein